jgi:hypothetical protein
MMNFNIIDVLYSQLFSSESKVRKHAVRGLSNIIETHLKYALEVVGNVKFPLIPRLCLTGDFYEKCEAAHLVYHIAVRRHPKLSG